MTDEKPTPGLFDPLEVEGVVVSEETVRKVLEQLDQKTFEQVELAEAIQAAQLSNRWHAQVAAQRLVHRCHRLKVAEAVEGRWKIDLRNT